MNLSDSTTPLIDTRGQSCPLPILTIRRALNHYHTSTLLLIYADDPSFIAEFKTFCLHASLTLITETRHAYTMITPYTAYLVRYNP